MVDELGSWSGIDSKTGGASAEAEEETLIFAREFEEMLQTLENSIGAYDTLEGKVAASLLLRP